MAPASSTRAGLMVMSFRFMAAFMSRLTAIPQAQAASAAPIYIKRDCATAASMKEVNSGWGANGLDLSSGWNCTPMYQG